MIAYIQMVKKVVNVTNKLMLILLMSVLTIGCEIEHTYENDTRSRIASLVSALVQMSADIESLPDSKVGLNLLVENTLNLKLWKGPYLSKVAMKDSWGNSFIYKYYSVSGEFSIYSKGANEVDDLGGLDDIFCDKFCPNSNRYGLKNALVPIQ